MLYNIYEKTNASSGILGLRFPLDGSSTVDEAKHTSWECIEQSIVPRGSLYANAICTPHDNEKNMNKLVVKGIEIRTKKVNSEDYICISDMLKAKDGDFFIADWLRNRNTLEFLGIWEQISNPNFNYGEFAIIKSHAGLNRFKISVNEWVEKTSAIGIFASVGRYGGTFAHKDIAMEFGMWIHPEFKIYLIKEFERLKSEEQKQLGWSAKRELTKLNYRIHTDAIKTNLIPPELSAKQASFIYADEADVLNVAMFGMTASEWRKRNPDAKGNIRDHASINELICLANMESINAVFISKGISQKERLLELNRIAISQMKTLLEIPNRELLVQENKNTE